MNSLLAILCLSSVPGCGCWAQGSGALKGALVEQGTAMGSLKPAQIEASLVKPAKLFVGLQDLPRRQGDTFFKLNATGTGFAWPYKNIPWFWSFGVDCVSTGTERAKYDGKNPSYAAFKLFPDDKAWVDDTINKLTAWQFNSTGGWSDDDTFKKYAGERRLPFFVVLHLGSYDHAPWHDLFAPQMEKAVDQAAKDQIPKLAGDPYLVGYFSDNELGWWDDTLFYTYLKFTTAAPGKRAMMALMRRHYGNDFKRLRKDWITPAKSFEELAKIAKMNLRPGGGGARFLNAWTFTLGTRYYKLMRDTIRRYDGNHLILGDRYCQYYTLPIVQASKPYVDVVSTNFGADWNDGSVSHFFLDTLHQVTGKPVIVTEFYMCANQNRSGNKNSSGGFPIVETQAERAASFKKYMTALASLPYVIGAHWFQFTDEPAKGRGDGENYNMGLVDTAGRPYEELTDVAAHLDITKLHSRASHQKQPKLVSIPQAPHNPMKDLRLWPRNAAFLSSGDGTPFADLYATWDDHNLYLAIYAMDYMDESLYMGGKVPESERSRWEIRLDGWAESKNISARVGLPQRQITIRFGGNRRKPTCSEKLQVSEVPGLRDTIIVRIPFKEKLVATDFFFLSSNLSSHSRKQSMSWFKGLALSK